MGDNTPRSSITMVDRRENMTGSDKEILQDDAEANFEKYGGDEIHEPLPKTTGGDLPPTHSTFDPNMVNWDGPDDQTNPQNWSSQYKWFITIICSIMTIDVYALFVS
jgi:DHA1 family multidrug resistance protein-like MFS transporter